MAPQFTQIHNYGEKGSGTRPPSGGVQDFYQLRDKCLRNGNLFEDPVFTASDQSLGFGGPRREFKWLRPSELNDNPKFISEGASRFDVCQGELGDCWLLAAVANLTLNQTLFNRVVPPDQSFKNPEYAGIFHFRFWQYGKWVDVVVDDRLPTVHGQLVLMHSKDKTEFWSALMEKAYAKLYGSYDALKGGTACEAMEDFTGGLTEWYDLQANTTPNLFQIMVKAHERGSLLGCSIEVKESQQREDELESGLIVGHAYSITDVKYVNLKTPRVSGKIPLIRVRNPWGNEAEWKGAWSDSSPEWTVVSPAEKQELGLNFDADGEFWISFQDFNKHFTRLEICNLSPDSLEEDNKRHWETSSFDGAWVCGISAGGCRNNLTTFHLNPQFMITLVDPDEEDDEDTCTCIVALMQKNRRAKKRMGLDSLTIGFAIYEITDDSKTFMRGEPVAESRDQGQQQVLSTDFFKYNASVARSATFINLRELSERFRLKPGKYCIIPSTFDPNEEGEFILRIFNEKLAKEVCENDHEIGIIEQPKTNGEEKQDAEDVKNSDASVHAFFAKIAGEDMEVDYDELQQVLNHALKKEFKFDGFSVDSCKSMIAILDNDRSGKLGFDEFTALWKNIRQWCTIFRKYDKDNSATISASELREALLETGLSVNRTVLHLLILRYGVEVNTSKNSAKKNGPVERALTFNDFIHCGIKLRHCIDVFNQKKSESGGYKSSISSASGASFTLEEFIESVMYA